MRSFTLFSLEAVSKLQMGGSAARRATPLRADSLRFGVLRRLLVTALLSCLLAGCQEPASEVGAEPEASPARPVPAEMRTFEIARSIRKFEVQAGAALVIDNHFGDVEVAAGGAEVQVESVVYARGADLEDARVRAASLTIDGKPDPDDGFTIAVEYGGSRSDVRADLAVAAPPETPLKVRVRAGRTRVRGLAGVEVRGQAGDVEVSHIAGAASVDTTSGDVRETGVRGRATVRCSSGSVELAGIGDSVLARTLSGRISLTDIRGDSLTTSTGSGDIDVGLSMPWAGQLEARSKSGRITVYLPADSNCRVRTATGSGDIASELPLTDVSRQGRNISGRLGRGEGLVDIATGSGDIRLLPAR
jgi:hypothetical protein